MASKRTKRGKRFAMGGTTSSIMPLPSGASTFTSPSQPVFGGGRTQGGPPYFPDYVPPSELASKTKLFRKGGKVKSASKRADGCAIRGKTRAR